MTDSGVQLNLLLKKKEEGTEFANNYLLMLRLEHIEDRKRVVLATEGEKSLIAELWLPESQVAYLVYDKSGFRFQTGNLQKAIDAFNRYES